MRNSKDLIGKTIVSIDEGRLIGTVRDVYLDPTLTWLAGVHLGKEGLISRRSLLIPRESIAVFGVDFVLAKQSDVIADEKKLPAAESWLRLDKLQGRDVDTTGGTKVGVIGDAILDEEARIVGFTLSRVYVEGPVAESRTIYQEAIVDKGQEDGTMTVDLTLVERQSQAGGPLDAAPEKMPELETASEETIETEAPGSQEEE